MTIRNKWINQVLFVFVGITIFCSRGVQASESVTLYTPYTKIFVSPGASIDYSVDVINNSKQIQNNEISVTGIPRGWTYTLTSGGYKISQLAVLPGEKKNLSLKVDVPYQVNKGNFRFKVMAGDSVSMPLVIAVAEKGSYETEMTTNQPNMQGSSTSTFNYTATLTNRTAEQQLYSLVADVSQGWNVVFKVDGKQVTSVELPANTTKDIFLEITAPSQIEAGTYQVPVSARTGSTSANVLFEVVITGTYSMELSTPNGLLSNNITAGDGKRIELVVKNTGSSILSGINLSASTPSNWDVVFEPKKIDKLLPGKLEQVFATVKADKKAIPGDYVLNMEAQTPEASSKAAFRMSVETPMLWGWIGVLIIGAALGSVYYLFRKYGRR
jgi:uncharacterized membrane protein